MLIQLQQAKEHIKTMGEPAKHNLDFASLAVIAGTFFAWLPHLAALLAVVWWLIRLYETRTVQRWLGREVKERHDDAE